MDYAELEIGLYSRDVRNYAVEQRFSSTKSATDIRLRSGMPVYFDTDRLRMLELNDADYGRLLSESLFADPNFAAAFAQAQTSAQSLDIPIRIRLFIGPGAVELHSLRWETLCDPKSGTSLVTSENLLFSRYLSSFDWRTITLRPKSALRALVVIANPNDIESYSPNKRQLATIDVQGELERATAALSGISMDHLASNGTASLEKLTTLLREGYDILYLICHGALVEGLPYLWLEGENGKTDRVLGDNLIIRLRELRHAPRLIVLASCQSAGAGVEARSEDGGALAALGPGIAAAGIPAVLAMQGNVSMHTIEEFMPIFFRELQRDGQIDRAVAVARGAVRERLDWWVPALFMRLKSGRLWNTPGFTGDTRLEKWPAVLRNINDGDCTPIIGPGFVEYFLESRRNIAQQWAETYHFPMAPHLREDLPEVAQYLAYNQDLAFPQKELLKYLRQYMLHQYANNLSEDIQDADLDGIITSVWERYDVENKMKDPYVVLASLPLPIYVTTNFSSILDHALKKVGKDPQTEICLWNDEIADWDSVYDTEPEYRPTIERPLVFHLFGHFAAPDSLVLTEDDYFDFLIGATRNEDLIPGVVRRAFADTGLLFLGYQLESWDFRVLFRSLISQPGGRRRARYAHVAAQIDPEGGDILDPGRARSYLESYFTMNADISIYWGSPEEFMRDLRRFREGGTA